MTNEQRVQIDHAMVALLTHLQYLRPGLPGRLPPRTWAEYVEKVDALTADLREQASAVFPRTKHLNRSAPSGVPRRSAPDERTQ